jgi:hypothetical protein
VGRAVADTPEPPEGEEAPVQQPPSTRRQEEDGAALAADLVAGMPDALALPSPPCAAPPPLASVFSSAGALSGAGSELSGVTGFGSGRKRHGSRVQPLSTADSDAGTGTNAFPSARGAGGADGAV